LGISDKGVSAIDWSSESSIIAAGSYDGVIKVWNATSGELIQTMKTPEHYAPTFDVFT